MAVEFNLTLALQQESKAKEYYQLYCNGEMEISDEDLQTLQEQYKGKIEHWKPEETQDKNDYNIEDDNGNDFGRAGRITASGVSISGGIFGITSGSIKGGIIGCLAAFAEGLIYTLTDPNKAEHQKLMELKNVMEGEILPEMENAGNTIEVTEEEIETVLEEYNDDKDAILTAIDEKTEELNALKEERQVLQDKADSGEELDESEQARYEELNEQIGTLSHEIDVLNAAVTKLSEETEEDVESHEGDLEEAQNTALTAEEAAERAAEFDEETKTNAIIETAIQGANVIGGTLSVASVAPMIMNPFAAAAAAAGASGVVMSGIGVGEQIKIASDITEEIKLRQNLFGDATNLSNAAEEGLDNVDTTVNSIDQDIPEAPETQEEPTNLPDFSAPPQPEEAPEENPEGSPKKKPEAI